MFILGSSFYSAWNQVNSRRLPAWLAADREPARFHEFTAQRIVPDEIKEDSAATEPRVARRTELDTTFSVCGKNGEKCQEYLLRLRIVPAPEEINPESQTYAVESDDSLSALRKLEIMLAPTGRANWTREHTKAEFKEAIDDNWYDLYRVVGLGQPIINITFQRLLIPVELAASDESEETTVMLEFDLQGGFKRAINAGNCAGGAQLNESETALLTCSGVLKFKQDTFVAFEQPRTAFVSFLNDTAFAVVVDDQYYSAIFGNSQIKSLAGDTLFTYNFAGYLPGPRYSASAGIARAARAQLYYNDDYGEVILFYDDRPRRPRHFSLPELRRFAEPPPGAFDELRVQTPGGAEIAFYFGEKRGLMGYTGGAPVSF